MIFIKIKNVTIKTMNSRRSQISFVILSFFAAAAIFGVAIFSFDVSVKTVFAQLNGNSPEISNVQISEVQPGSFTVTWETDKQTSSQVNFGVDRRYGIVRDPGFDKTEHEIIIDELFPGTKYFFRVVSIDDQGNQGIASNYSVRTAGSGTIEQIERVESIDDKEKLEQIAALIEGLTEEEAVARLQNEAQQAAEGISDDLTIVGPPNVEPDVNSALITWETNRESDSTVLFSPENQYNSAASNPYAFSQSGVGGLTTSHSVQIIGLEPFTTYHFQVVSEDRLGITGRSEDFTFRTKALLPVVQDFRVIKAEENAATLGWSTTVPSSALLEYEDTETGEEFSKGSPARTTEHVLRISDLKFGAEYRAVAVAESEGGETVRSDPLIFRTVLDEEPPVISNVANESTLFPGVETRVQTIISWNTDEAAICSLFYRQGLSPTVEPTEVPHPDENPSEKHVRILVSFTPSTVYQYWTECADRSGNEERSENFVLFTPQQEKSIIDIILENFEGAFGWVKDL